MPVPGAGADALIEYTRHLLRGHVNSINIEHSLWRVRLLRSAAMTDVNPSRGMNSARMNTRYERGTATAGALRVHISTLVRANNTGVSCVGD